MFKQILTQVHRIVKYLLHLYLFLLNYFSDKFAAVMHKALYIYLC